jgi:uncharacterized protein
MEDAVPMSISSHIRTLAQLIVFAALTLAFAVPGRAEGVTEARYALVIGNADYALGQLKNPVHDARSMAAVLLETGFETTLRENLTSAQMEDEVTAFLATVPEGAVGLFYYAGHAVQRDGRNYLLPVDIEVGSADKIIGKSMSANDLIDRFHKRGIEFGIFILDACRNNPFLPGDTESGRGLASMESESGETLIGFATQAGDVAFDGTGPNSPYTGALVSEIDKPGRDILDVFRSVRRSVRIWTDGRQRPFISASVERNFSFRPASSGEAAPPLDIGELTPDRVRPVVEDIWWATIEGSKVPDDFRAFIQHFPESQKVEMARKLTVNLEEQGIQVRGLDLVDFAIPVERRDPTGLSAVVTDCDIVAGDPDDPRRITDGVPWGLVNVRDALRACSAALADDPTNLRLQHQMGRILDIQGRFDEAESFYRLAGASDYSASLVNLGFMSVSERGRERDYPTAMTLYRRAADQGNLRARTNIGEMFERGWSVPKNLDEAVLWYKLAAQNGWPNALDTLANLYRKGRDEAGQGLDKNLDEAIRLYRIASELGHSNAMNNLGQLYLSDELPEKNVDEGIRWLTKAADRGNRFAPYNLGRAYRDGKIVKRDYALAIALFERSSDLGFAPARIALGRMYVDGQGVEKSKTEAAFQFNIAILTADGKRPEEKEEAVDRLAKLNLSEDELTEARARAEDWVSQNGG